MRKSPHQLYLRYAHNITIAIEAILSNKVKSFLTALGIMFGVAAVISMLAIGKGAQQEVLEQIKLVGVNNIIVTPVDQAIEANGNSASNGDTKKKKFSRGLHLLDAQAILQTLESVKKVSPVVSLNYHAIKQGKSYPVTLEGVSSDYFDMLNMGIDNGKIFSPQQSEKGVPVCVIGDNIRHQFFNQLDPIGQYIKCGQVWLQVIGVIEKRDFTTSASDEMGISSSDNKIIIPIKTMLMRFKDKGAIKPEVMDNMAGGGFVFFMGGNDEEEAPKESNPTLHQLDKIIVQVEDTEQLSATADVINRMILRRHSNTYDFEVTVPELLLKQQQKTNEIFNIVLGAIAGISLIVGGIGIMNIMLASVWERIREIGTRQAIGASRIDIIVQFLAESTLISISGGLIGIVLGVVLAHIIHLTADIKTIVSMFSVLIAFSVSATVGIVFGYIPAKRAASQDPVESLRH
ncbi:ABC transporter permease [Carboxylicivirga sp. M1479]|uniref:ABC transporter permease n=1 Tax=Carboxylicivirga sp. M1479 TaxID=2594476 RepID=UPI0011773EFF|nr:ABC transporter permease [Carboxylicivirga sp. M1479]TRX71904.1 FtsX-like permease family protein [Carboxylicivirga sp. M1479]